MRSTLGIIALLIGLLSGSAVAQDPPTEKIEDVTTTVGKVFKSAEGRFTVVFPGDPKVQAVTVETDLGPLTLHQAILIGPSAAYHVSYSDLPVGPETPAQKKQRLDGSRDELIAAGLRLITETDVTIAGIGGREWLMERGGAITRVRAFFLDQRFYQLIFHAPVALAFRNGKPSPNPADRTEIFEKISLEFFDSFKLIK